MNGYAYYEYLKVGGERLFTVVALPKKEGKFPTVVCRSPYVKSTIIWKFNSEIKFCKICKNLIHYVSSWYSYATSGRNYWWYY